MISVVDTNVWVTMDLLNAQPPELRACVQRCVEWGVQFRQSDDKIAADYTWKIMGEYRKNIRPGGLAQQYLNQFLSKPITRLVLVAITFDDNGDAVLPQPNLVTDPSDRKFVAVALQFTPPAPIINATDTDWQKDREALKNSDVHVQELCLE